MSKTASFFCTVVSLFLFSFSLKAEQPFSKEEYKLFANIEEAKQSVKFGKLEHEKLLEEVSKIIKVKVDKLKTAETNVRPNVSKAIEFYKGNVQTILDKEKVRRKADLYTLKGKVLEVNLVLTGDHPVGFIRWKNSNKKHLQEEACLAAYAFGKTGDLVDTLVLQAIDPALPEDEEFKKNQVFEAKITGDSLKTIKLKRIASFADSRLIKRFDGVKYNK